MSQFEYVEIFYAVHIFPSEDTITNTLTTATAPFQPCKRCVPSNRLEPELVQRKDCLGGELARLGILKTSKWRQSA
jgi:hypothetical protein